MVEVVLHIRRRLDESETNSLLPDVEVRLPVARPFDGERRGQGAERIVKARDPQRNVPQRTALAWSVGRKERQLPAARIGAEKRERIGPVDHVHSEMRREDVGDRVALGDPVRDVVELRRLHAPTVPTRDGVMRRYLRASTARWSCCFVIRERPSMPIRFASLYSCAFVRPFGRFVPERRPPRRPDDRSERERREDVLASPFRARSLLTVRAAISFALRFGVPRSSRLSSMCSYCRSRFADHACCGMDLERISRCAGYVPSSGGFWTLCSVA